MKRNSFIALIAMAVIISFASCGGAGPANDPDLAAAVITSACAPMNNDATAGLILPIGPGSVADFAGSAYFSSEGAGVISYNTLSFDNFEVEYEDATYTIDGDLHFASTIIESSVDPESEAITISSLAYIYTEGVSISGPDISANFSVDMKQETDMTMLIADGNITIDSESVLDGKINDKAFVGQEISVHMTMPLTVTPPAAE